jgi:hypothetical protein
MTWSRFGLRAAAAVAAVLVVAPRGVGGVGAGGRPRRAPPRPAGRGPPPAPRPRRSANSAGRRRAAASPSLHANSPRTDKHRLPGERSCQDALVTEVTRLVTLVELSDDVADAQEMTVSVRHEAVLADGRRVLLLGDRGWREQLRGPGAADIWSHMTVEDIEDTARTVVGPDEPFEDRSQADMETGHWAHLENVLREHRVGADADKLKQLPHDVVLGPRLRGRIGQRPGRQRGSA